MISIENLVKKYGKFNLDISMTIPAGTVVGLIGKNGAGKSTTIKAILGLIRPDDGRVTVFGTESRSLSPEDKMKIGAALAESGFSSELDIQDVAAIMSKLYPGFQKDRFISLCVDMGLNEKKQIKKYSTGMKAKLRVLVAMSHDAKLLVLDEPTAGLDIDARNEILDMIRKYLEEDEERSVLITSHISSDLEGLCDEIYLIHDGRIMLHEETGTILDNYAILKISEEKMKMVDQQYLLKTRKEAFGYSCLTNEKQYYAENYPDIVIENGKIDDVILYMTGGKR